MTNLTYSGVLVLATCCDCGIPFGIDSRHQQRLRESHAWFYCPNGHKQHYLGETESEKLARQLKSARANAQLWRDQAETAENRRRAEKAAKTRLKNRIAKGVCPCCQRSFVDLARHMAGQHPDYTEEAL